MNRNAPTSTDDGAPFGVTPRRSPVPVYMLGAIYLAWFGFLIWMALTQVGWK